MSRSDFARVGAELHVDTFGRIESQRVRAYEVMAPGATPR